MKFDDLLFSRRTRQNHALEHATFTIMATMDPSLSVSARSNNDGFIIFGDVDLDYYDGPWMRLCGVSWLARLRWQSIPTVVRILAVGVSMVTIGTLLGMASSNNRTRVASTAASSVAGWMAARPLGEYVQKHLTTLPDVAGVRVTDITRRKLFGFTFIEVRTVQE